MIGLVVANCNSALPHNSEPSSQIMRPPFRPGPLRFSASFHAPTLHPLRWAEQMVEF